ncbi:MAG: hypothetical protein KBD63_00190 [Bacteriovoracaceae bacterium]|nr:hypothetical protein [Bacteriovoracaceae bacterium]
MLRLSIILFFLNFLQNIYAQENIFQSDEVINLQIKASFKKIFKDRKNRNYYPAQFIYKDKEREWQDNVEVRVRGDGRATYCEFPPLKIKTSNLSNLSLLKENEDYKLVTHCGYDSEEKITKGSNDLLMEYIAYKIFNIYTPFSFNVRLFNTTYFDTKIKKEIGHSYSIVLERPSSIGSRNKLEYSSEEAQDWGKLALENINNQSEEYHLLITLIQYLLGSADWKIASDGSPNNLKLFFNKNDKKVMAIPYDLDGLRWEHAGKDWYKLRAGRVYENCSFNVNQKMLQETAQAIYSKKDEVISLYQKYRDEEGLNLKDWDSLTNAMINNFEEMNNFSSSKSKIQKILYYPNHCFFYP